MWVDIEKFGFNLNNPDKRTKNQLRVQIDKLEHALAKAVAAVVTLLIIISFYAVQVFI